MFRQHDLAVSYRLSLHALLSVLFLPCSSHAQVAEPVAWRPEWERFRTWEYVATAGAMATGFGFRFLGRGPPHEENTWAFEDDIADALALRSGAGDALRTAGDIGYVGTMVYRFVDSALIPSLYWGKGDVAWQMLMMDLEAFSVVAAVVWGSQAFVGRQRPRFRDCPAGAPDGTSCLYFGDNRYRSFITGHFAVATTGASLTCLHHARLGLYGGGTADDVACGAHVAAAITTGVSRLVLEEHYLSDTLLAGALGVFAGYVVPSALHYGFGAERAGTSVSPPTQPSSPTLRVTLLPFSQRSTLGVSAVGLF